MLLLTTTPQDILGTWQLTGGAFISFGYESPCWVLRAQAWQDLAPRPEGYEGLEIYKENGVKVPILLPITIRLEEVSEMIYLLARRAFGPIDIPVEGFDAQTRSELLDPLFKRICDHGQDPAATVRYTLTKYRTLTTEEFFTEITAGGGLIEEGHTCCPGQLHLTFAHPDDLQLLVAYRSAQVFIG